MDADPRHAGQAARRLAGKQTSPHVEDAGASGPSASHTALPTNRAAEKITGTTLRGPQKDDFNVLFENQDAADFASEGQQRLLVLALCLGRLKRDELRTPTPPVILADDVLGELDDTRRRAFWQEVGDSHQVIATGTVPPPSGNWLTYKVSEGTYTRA